NPRSVSRSSSCAATRQRRGQTPGSGSAGPQGGHGDGYSVHPRRLRRQRRATTSRPLVRSRPRTTILPLSVSTLWRKWPGSSAPYCVRALRAARAPDAAGLRRGGRGSIRGPRSRHVLETQAADSCCLFNLLFLIRLTKLINTRDGGCNRKSTARGYFIGASLLLSRLLYYFFLKRGAETPLAGVLVRRIASPDK